MKANNSFAKKVAGFAFIILTSTSAYIANAQTVTTPKVRTDGVYYLTQQSSGGPLHYVVRFYDDGQSVENGPVAGDLARAAALIRIDNPNLVPGRWSMERGDLVFMSSSGFSERTRKGKLSAEGWVINATVTFKFLPVAFPKEASTTRNRRPYFVGPGKQTQVFQYDAAGRRTGVHHELEIEAKDPDGDPLNITWKVSNGSIVGEGAKVLWKSTGAGTVTVTLDDGKGGRTVSTIDLN